MRITIFCLLMLCFAISPACAQNNAAIDSLMAHMGIALGADEKIVEHIDTNKLYRTDIDKDVQDRHFYHLLNYQHTLKVKVKGEMPVSWLFIGVEGGKVARLIFVLSKASSGQVSKLLGTPQLISMFPGIRADDTELRAWEYPAYNVSLYSNMADNTARTLIIYNGDARKLFKL